MGDVAATEGPPLPFVDVDTLDEATLATPLVVRWPHVPELAGRRVETATSAIDVARTAMAALGFSSPEAFGGADVAPIARGTFVPAGRPLLAAHGARFSIRWGPFILLGSRDRETRLCDVSLDPACVADVRATTPLALEPLRRWAADGCLGAWRVPAGVPARGPAVLDARALVKALVRWGRPPDDHNTDPN